MFEQIDPFVLGLSLTTLVLFVRWFGAVRSLNATHRQLQSALQRIDQYRARDEESFGRDTGRQVASKAS